MKATIKLMHVLVKDITLYYQWKDFTKKNEFNSYISKTPLLNISHIWVLYKMNKHSVLQLELKNSGYRFRTWEVFCMNEPFFTFESSKVHFFKNLEEALHKELATRTMIRTKPPKKLDSKSVD